ncbi:MAG: MIP/aquaporin family protein [Parachlamydiaceae bacterium]
MMKYIYEFIGTFFLVLTVGMTVLEPHSVGLWAPLAIGSALAVMVFAGGHISGGHYNPAVSLAAFMRKKLPLNDLWAYWSVQFAAGIVAALIASYLKGGNAAIPLELHPLKALLAEFLFTFALCYVVLNVATTKATAGNSYFGWAIGFTVLVGAYAMGPISGAAFNPAVALGVSILNLTHWTNLWIYLVANLLGAAAAAWVVNEAHPENGKELHK